MRQIFLILSQKLKKSKQKDKITYMVILAIDTSCDDTCVAILETRNKKLEILSNVVSSQVKIHQKWGGVYPTLAKREHQRNLVPVSKKALEEANLLEQGEKKKIKIGKLKGIFKKEDYLLKELENFLIKYGKPKIDLITVTIGPGLEPCLWVGVNFARALAYFYELSIIPINHVEAHIFANFIRENSQFLIPNFQFLVPAICLVVSGGHTQLILMKKFGKYKILGETRDDAAGECFDKVARILGLGYPGGPVIAAEAAKLKIKNLKLKIKLPRPMINQKNFDFSFSGLKTAVLYDFKSRPQKVGESKEYIQTIAAELQQAIVDVLINKTLRAAREFNTKSVILGGGVVANNELRRQFREKIKKELPHTKYLIPDIKFCTDNAVMVGITAYSHYLRGERRDWKRIMVDANLTLK
jgi:N6-L-threonylcarbamoyladenine synthase